MKKLFKNLFINQSGFSLVEVMVASGVLGVIALIMVGNEDTMNSITKQGSFNANRQKITSVVQKLLSSKDACENSLVNNGPVNPTGTSGTVVTSLRDADNNEVLATNQVFADGGAGRFRVAEMRVSHYQNTAADPSNHYNRNRETSFSLRLEKLGKNARFVEEHFRIRVDLNGANNITDCDGEVSFDPEEVCDFLQGVYDPGAGAPKCRSVYMAKIAGGSNGIRGAVDNDIAVEFQDNSEVSGITVVNKGVNVSTSTTTREGTLLVPAGTRIQNEVSVGTDTMPAGVPNTTLFLNRGLGIGTLGNTVGTNDVRTTGDVHTGEVRVFNAIPGSFQRYFVATVGYVRDRLSKLVSSNASDASDIVNDVTNAFNNSNTVGDAMARYVCTNASGNRIIRMRGGSGDAAGSFNAAGATCTIDQSFQSSNLHNCQQDIDESDAAARANCSSIYGTTIRIRATSRTNWNYAL
jgi:prepilin-type N-terminal cleavage/methylation domain-containing protein